MISSTCMTLVVIKKVLLAPASSGRKPLRSINPVIHPATRTNTMGYTGIGSWIPKKKHGRFAMSGTGNDRVSHRYKYPYLLSCGLTGPGRKTHNRQNFGGIIQHFHYYPDRTSWLERSFAGRFDQGTAPAGLRTGHFPYRYHCRQDD